MEINDGTGRTHPMAGKSPWGGGKGTEPGSGGGEPAAPSGSPDPAADQPAGDKPRTPRNPWLPPADEPRRSASIEDIFKNRGPEGPRRLGGGGSGGPGFRLPQRPGGKSWFPLAVGAIALVWLSLSMVHQVGPKEEGVVTTFGKYSRTLTPGLSVTLPWPIQQVDVEEVSEFRIEQIPDGSAQKLMLTGDQNLVDLSYIVRWTIKDLKQFRFQLDAPEETVREVAEAAMRATVAQKRLNDVIGSGRADIEQDVLARIQAILDAYESGIQVQGVEIRKTDPPKEVEEAFKDVSAAQQDADAEINRAEAYAQQILARAQGDAASFDKIYAQYKLAPEVTKRRLYYETMERVLRQNDKTVIEAPGVQSYLPLPELKRRAQTANPAEAQ